MNALRIHWLALAVAAILCGAAVLCGGCGPATNSHPTAKLAGRVTLDGQPIAKGRIQFYPITAGGQPDDAEINDGQYSAERVPRGKVRVIFLASHETGKIIHEPGNVFPEIKSIIPDQYQSGIEIEVSDDNPNQVFALDSTPSAKSGKGG
ncbi:MAG TPA: hypothetical protein VGY55_20570 [Pirellulales bacterium]|jgi:hypothetical protein|nr:hypothetical protein [Pirellulales bacterium]